MQHSVLFALCMQCLTMLLGRSSRPSLKTISDSRECCEEKKREERNSLAPGGNNDLSHTEKFFPCSFRSLVPVSCFFAVVVIIQFLSICQFFSLSFYGYQLLHSHSGQRTKHILQFCRCKLRLIHRSQSITASRPLPFYGRFWGRRGRAGEGTMRKLS